MVNKDITYCTSETCKSKCDRHKDLNSLDENELYWFCDFNADPNRSCEWRRDNGKNR